MSRNGEGILSGALCYLIGSIDRVSDHGKGWRRDFVHLCRERKLNIKFLDPTNKISFLKKEVDEEQIKIREMKDNQRWDELSDFMHQVVRSDHRCIDYSDFVVCYLDLDCHMCGSYFELQSVLTEKKPYFIIVKDGKKNTPSWLFGILDHTKIFDSIDEVTSELEKLNNGKRPLDDRWVLIRKEIENLSTTARVENPAACKE